MPILIACPTCKGPLRVADGLVGRPVRCPACHNVFEAVPPAGASTGPDAGPVPGRADAAPPGGKPGLKGAVEVKLSLDDQPPAARAPAQPPEREQRRPPPRLAEDDEDLLECPACGRSNHRDDRRCYHCGERLGGRYEDEGRGRSLARREPLRRDAEPHRGTMILVLGIVALVSMGVCPLVGAVLGVMAWVMGHGDLRKIRARQMDPEGEGITQAGWVCGIIATILNTLSTLACAGFMALMINETYNAAPTTRARFGTPVQPKRPGPPGPVRKF
jgi:hypothetical protein